MAETKFDPRTEQNLKTLLPEAEAQAREFLKRSHAAGFDVKIISGSRTIEEQEDLYALGRTKSGKVVTNARGGQSSHNYGVAWDIGIFEGGKYLDDGLMYDRIGAIARSMGLEWGGDWSGIVDRPHFQCRTGKSTKELKKLVETGEPVPILPLAIPVDVEVYLDGVRVEIPAHCVDGRTWVAARAFTDVMGGDVVKAGGEPYAVTIDLNSSRREMPGQVINGVGYVKFADVNTIYGLEFVFNSKKSRLDMSRP